VVVVRKHVARHAEGADPHVRFVVDLTVWAQDCAAHLAQYGVVWNHWHAFYLLQRCVQAGEGHHAARRFEARTRPRCKRPTNSISGITVHDWLPGYALKLGHCLQIERQQVRVNK
jgi:hypothetical protein